MQTNALFFTLQEQYGMKFYQMPKVFFTNEKYKNLSNDAKILYALLHDRLQLSIKNRWIDSSDSLYFVYTNQNLSEILNVSPRKITNIKKELMDAQLLSQEQKGFNTAFRLYLMKPEITVEDMYQINQAESGKDTAPVTNDSELGAEIPSSVADSATLEKPASNQVPNSLANSATLQETASNQHSHRLANSARPVSQNLLPNDTEIINTKYKDNKDYKDQRFADSEPNFHFNTAFKNAPEETDEFMIEKFVEEKALVEKYGEGFLNILRSYARKDYLLFRESINAVEFATKSAEKEAGKSIGIHFLENMSPYAEALKEDYITTLYGVLRHIRTNHEIRNPKAYFFISFKNVAEHWIDTIRQDEERKAKQSNQEQIPFPDFE